MNLRLSSSRCAGRFAKHSYRGRSLRVEALEHRECLAASAVASLATMASERLDHYAYVAAPTISKLSVASGPVPGGTPVTITGKNFTGATAVMFGAAAAKIVSVSATSIVAISPQGTSTVNVAVSTPGGTSAGKSFTYVVPPVSLANSLANVTVSATALQLTPGGPVDPAGMTLVVLGTAKNDSIVIQPSSTLVGGADVILNGARSAWAAPIANIVVNGLAGNDTITVDPRLKIRAYLFGGTGNDTIIGGGASSVIVGGTGSNVLTGSSGADVIMSGGGVATMYDSAASANGNLLVTNYSSTQFSLPAMQSVLAGWTGADTRAARITAAQNTLGPTLVANGKSEMIYQASSADFVVALPATPVQVWTGMPGISNAWFTNPTTDANGFTIYQVKSTYQSTVNAVRVLLPAGYSSAKTYKVMYVLPVEAGLGTTYGDGLITIKSLNLQSTYPNTIFVAPSFSELPWYADSATTTSVWEETYFTKVIVPMIDKSYPTKSDAADRLLLGFSKSGYGAWTLLMRHPDMFGRALAWDSPLALTSAPSGAGWGFAQNVGTQANFYANYEIITLLQKNAAWLKTQPPRLYMMGHALGFTLTMTLQIQQEMNSLGIPYVFPTVIDYGNHAWWSGWVPKAVQLLES